MGFIKILFVTDTASLKRSLCILVVEVVNDELASPFTLNSVSLLFEALCFPISINTKAMGFKIAKLIGAIKYKYEAYSGCVFLYNAATANGRL